MKMKRCPLCGATCFEDMDTCYCCMYRFDGDEPAETVLIAGLGAPSESTGVEDDEAAQEDRDAVCEACEPSAETPEIIGEPEELPEFSEVSWQEVCEIPIVEADCWFPSVSGQEETTLPHVGVSESSAFAFGPVIETLEGVGECLRFDIPLVALAQAAAAVTSRVQVGSAMR